MPKDKRYQLVVMGPAADDFWSELAAEFNRQIQDIGLDPGTDAEILRSSTMHLIQIQWDCAPVAIWFGDSASRPSTQRDQDLLEDFQVKRPNPVFPVCESLDHYDSKVPKSLCQINGQAWEAAPVVANVLKAFNLTREERQVFISYRRSDSAAIAQQLYGELQRRKFRAFLDTASVEAGVLFQDVLHGRLSDVDLVVFLDTKNAFDSDWVFEELLQAEKQGFGILQVLWPDRRRDPATQFCDLYELEKARDFVKWSPALNDEQPDPGDELRHGTVGDIAHHVERTRIRSIRHRRDQVLTELVDIAQKMPSLEVDVSPTGSKEIPFSFIELRRGGSKKGLAFPVIGFPDSLLLQSRHELLKLQQLPSACVVYDEFGITPRLRAHLDWLNQALAIKTIPITSIGQWMQGL